MNTCPVDECTRPLKRGGYCYAHYMKNWRYGTPTPEHPARWEDIRGQRFGTLVVALRVDQRWECHCDCGETRLVSAGELNREGDSNTCGVKANHRSDNIGYGSAHSRVRSDRGSASRHRCVECGGQAKHWAYDHADPDERTDPTLGCAYSTDTRHYQPRCVPCHKRFDLAHINGTSAVLNALA